MEDFDPTDPEDHDPHYGDAQQPRDADGSDELEADIMRADHPFGVGLWGTTAREAEAGEGLDRALAEERPEEPPTDEALSIVEEGPVDTEAELFGNGVTARDEFASPEETALSARDEAPGATDHLDPDLPEEDVDAIEEYLEDEEG